MGWLYVLVAVFLALTPVAVWAMRRDYRRRRRLTPVVFGVMLIWFFLPHLAIDLASRPAWPRTPVQVAGLAIAVLGLGLCLYAIGSFRSAKKVFAFDAGTLTTSGLYRWSRHPQYVGWFGFVLGFTLMWWTWACLIALALLAIAIHVLVVVEEEHLRRVFGDAHAALCARTRRYLGARAAPAAHR